MFLKCLILAGRVFLLGSCACVHAAEPGFLKGHLKIVLSKEVELADQTQSQDTAPNYAGVPLIVLSRDTKKEVTRVVADSKGNYGIALQPGDYILDVPGRGPRKLRAKPEPFTVVSNQTVHVDMTVDTGVR
jgi:hypothetical protein